MMVEMIETMKRAEDTRDTELMEREVDTRVVDVMAAGAEKLFEEGDMEATKVKEEATEDDMVAETMEGKDNAVCVLGATTPISARNWRITVWREI